MHIPIDQLPPFVTADSFLRESILNYIPHPEGIKTIDIKKVESTPFIEAGYVVDVLYRDGMRLHYEFRSIDSFVKQLSAAHYEWVRSERSKSATVNYQLRVEHNHSDMKWYAYYAGRDQISLFDDTSHYETASDTPLGALEKLQSQMLTTVELK